MTGPCPFCGQAAPAAGEPLLVLAAHGERGGADAAAEVEGEDLRSLIAPELQGHEGKQHGFARARGADDKGVAYVADMET